MSDNNNNNDNNSGNTNSSRNNNTTTNIPYLSMFVITLMIGALVSYVCLDYYVQNKINMSLIQIVKKTQDEKNFDMKQHNSLTTYRININDIEHNFSFSDFIVKDLSIDGVELIKIKIKGEKQ